MYFESFYLDQWPNFVQLYNLPVEYNNGWHSLYESASLCLSYQSYHFQSTVLTVIPSFLLVVPFNTLQLHTWWGVTNERETNWWFGYWSSAAWCRCFLFSYKLPPCSCKCKWRPSRGKGVIYVIFYVDLSCCILCLIHHYFFLLFFWH